MADLLMEDSEDEAELVCTKEAMRWAPVQAARKSQGKHISSMNVLHSVLERIGAISVLACAHMCWQLSALNFNFDRSDRPV